MGNHSETPSRKTPWHIYPPTYGELDWLVPYDGENAVIHHGHRDPDDHSECGPSLFCCEKSRELFTKEFPNSAEAGASWGITSAEHIASWIERGVTLLYFVFCDPVRPKGLLAGGLSGEAAKQALFKEIPLEDFADLATRIL